MAVPYRYAVPVWTTVGGSAWPGGNDYVYDLTYDYFWGVDYQPYSYSYNVTRTITLEDHSPADEPEDDKWTRTDRGAAEASSMVYGDDSGELLSQFGIKYNPEDGFGAALYKVGDRYMLAFRGTDGLADTTANVGQAVGLKASQYEQAIKLAERVYKATGGNVIMVGHSLGGGLASAGAYATGARAVTFNAAGLHSRYRKGEHGGIRAHYMVGDPLSVAQDLDPRLPRGRASDTAIGGRPGT